VNFHKFADKCDSMKVAYQQKSVLLDSTVTNYFKLFDDMEKERLRNVELTQKLQTVNDDILSIYKSPFRNMGSFLTGTLVGALVVLLLAVVI